MDFWTDKRALVTGGHGFMGQVIVSLLYQRGARVFAPSRQHFDLRYRGQARDMLSCTNPEIVIHLAANVGGIGYNRAHPAELAYDNLAIGMNTVEAAYRVGVKRFVGVGTVCAYPKFSPVPFQESDLWNGYPEETNAPYGLAKRMLLVLLQAYRQQYGFESIYLLPVNLYGPGDHFDLEAGHVIPVLIRKFIEAKKAGVDKVTLWGDGSPTREFLYVTDAAKGILHMAEHYQGAEPINLGTGREISIQHLADLLREIIGYRGTIVWDTSQPNGQPRRCLDVSRATALGWRAEVELEQGLIETVNWYLRHN